MRVTCVRRARTHMHTVTDWISMSLMWPWKQRPVVAMVTIAQWMDARMQPVTHPPLYVLCYLAASLMCLIGPIQTGFSCPTKADFVSFVKSICFAMVILTDDWQPATICLSGFTYVKSRNDLTLADKHTQPKHIAAHFVHLCLNACTVRIQILKPQPIGNTKSKIAIL